MNECSYKSIVNNNSEYVLSVIAKECYIRHLVD